MTDTDAVRRLFDDLAGEYDQHLPFFATFGEELVSWCGITPGHQVLDLAAGRGAITRPAADVVGGTGRVLAVDNATAMVRALSQDVQDLPQVRAELMDIHDLEIPDAEFDMVTCGFALHFLDDPERALAEAYRVLRPSGTLAFSGPPTDHVSTPEAEEARDRRWDFQAELMKDMAERTEGIGRRILFTPPPKPLPRLCDEAGFVFHAQKAVTLTFPVRDPQHYWDWQMSHGFRGYVQALGPALADEFRSRLFAGLEAIHEDGDLAVVRTATFDKVTKPAD